MNLVLAFILIILESVFEGLNTAGHKFASEMVESVYLASVTLMAFAWLNRQYVLAQPRAGRFIKTLIGFLLLRFAIFDVAWNISAGQSLDYIGVVKVYDGVIQFINDHWGFGTVVFIKAILGFWGIAWLLPWGNKE